MWKKIRRCKESYCGYLKKIKEKYIGLLGKNMLTKNIWRIGGERYKTVHLVVASEWRWELFEHEEALWGIVGAWKGIVGEERCIKASLWWRGLCKVWGAGGFG